ncbi:MAG: 3-ketoacyl-ACP reductase [Planctomycetota bacterium]
MARRPVAFITGASRGIGRGIAVALAKQGYDIVGNATSYDPGNTKVGLGEVRERVETLGASFEPAVGDIADLDQHEALLNQALNRFQRIDVLVNNAGIAPERRLDVLETTPESYDKVLSVNTRGTFFLTQRFAKRMKADLADYGASRPMILFISSISATVASPSRAEYCMSKAAISQAARVFALRLAEYGIMVYEIRPGIIKTDMIASVKDQYEKKVKDGLVPQDRLGTPEDVAAAVCSLVKGDFRYSTGLIIEVSGGMQIRHL